MVWFSFRLVMQMHEHGLTEATVHALLKAKGYKPIVRVEHVHAQRALDERHICRVDELESLNRQTFLQLVESVFQTPGYAVSSSVLKGH